MLDADIQLYSHNIYHALNAISEPIVKSGTLGRIAMTSDNGPRGSLRG
ncbi:hypothetical protein GQ55_2G020500 [Panicum hallii var. hallii]|uniref:Uncharacterized protein n=1 Tax=Panicum hallii var. hallii TaxID=1504633 RepID=A0A2T7EKK2_9POAL|nr:hypothetical protein GQ55_2G020500 [Panicum hallii var. hallii]